MTTAERARQNHHLVLSLVFGCTALFAWFNAEFAPRRWPHLVEAAIDRVALQDLSFTAALCAGCAIWLTLAGPWPLVPWLVIALVLAFAADKLHRRTLRSRPIC